MVSAVARLPRRLGPHALEVAGAVAVATVLAGLIIRAAHGGLGTASPPFVMGLDVQADPLWTLLAALALALAVAALPRLAPPGRPVEEHAAPRSAAPQPAGATRRAQRRATTRHLAASTGLAAVVALAVGCARTGPAGLSAIFDTGPGGSFEAQNEYLPGLGALDHGVRFYLDRYAELVPSLPVNVAGHPPAPLLTLHVLGITTPAGLAALCLVAVALLPALTTLLSRALGLDPATARRAGAFALLSPVVLLLGVTSVDAIFAAIGAATAALLVHPRTRVLGCAALAVAAFWSWALLAIGAWAAIVVLRKEGARAALTLGAGCAVAVVAFDAALFAAAGYDAIGTLRATEAYYSSSVATVRPYAFWLFASPVAFGVLLGPPLVAGAITAARRRTPAALGLATVIGVATIAGFTKAETERIWLPFVPLACVAAAEALPARLDRRVLLLLAGQAAAFTVLFNPVW